MAPSATSAAPQNMGEAVSKVINTHVVDQPEVHAHSAEDQSSLEAISHGPVVMGGKLQPNLADDPSIPPV
jgi:hypothetical protein